MSLKCNLLVVRHHVCETFNIHRVCRTELPEELPVRHLSHNVHSRHRNANAIDRAAVIDLSGYRGICIYSNEG